jgi:copper resistance protein B
MTSKRKEVTMRTSCFLWIGVLLAFATPAVAADMMSDHGGAVFHMFRVETDVGSTSNGLPVQSWDAEGWVGTDDDKLWLKAEGEHKDHVLEEAEFWALYSRNIATFWDAQAGIRYDVKPESSAYLALGVNGLAPYFFETEAHLFVSQRGDVTARLREENDFLITQKLILQPYAEVNLSAQEVREQDIGAGITDGKVGLQTRYEFTRKFAPYVDIHYGTKFGETASIAHNNGEHKDEMVGAFGVRLMF